MDRRLLHFARLSLGHPALLLAFLVASEGASLAQEGSVSVQDRGAQEAPATFECTPGHRVLTHYITLDAGTIKYTFRYSGCLDPSHGDLHPSAEGNFGMPDPTACNWYWGGFLGVVVNGQDAVKYTLRDMRVVESGARGEIQVVWAHPQADVGLRLLLPSGSNHVLAQLTWRPTTDAPIKDVALQLRCYPSFFTAARNRRGERHCKTPRADEHEPNTLQLVPEQDFYLYYYDAVFDPARGEGDGPCAVLLAPANVLGGRVGLTNYAVNTVINLKPESGQTRFALYDFTGKTNTEAQAYLEAHATEDLTGLRETDFRPGAVRDLDLARLRPEATRLLAEAADDGKALEPKVTELLTKAAALQTQAQAGDWSAEADLASLIEGSTDLFWRLKTFALLNRP